MVTAMHTSGRWSARINFRGHKLVAIGSTRAESRRALVKAMTRLLTTSGGGSDVQR